MNVPDNLIGYIVSIDGNTYRIIFYQQKSYVLCQMDVNILVLLQYPAEFLISQIRNDVVSILKDSTPPVIDLELMDERTREKYLYRKAMMDEITKEYGPSYLALYGKCVKEPLKAIMNKYNVSTATGWKAIRLFLQSGMNPLSLVDGRKSKSRNETKLYQYAKKTGHPRENNMPIGVTLTSEVLEQFATALSFYKKGREMTLKNAYGWLIGHYYTTYTETGRSRVAPAFERPTYRQFTYYCHKNLTKTEKDIIKLGKAEQRNAKRLLLGSSRTDALRPGWIVEADALEVDCSIISELNPEQCIGRPILYMMIDVYSSAIVAFSVSLENNSMLGLTNLMLNLADNKVDLCQQYNINIQENLWPSGFIPHEIRCDRGSDFKSDIFANICNHLNITRTLESGGTGSMKGLVEQSFHQFQTQMRPHLENKGLITKRHDSNHHRTAMLNLREFTQMVINFIVTHNTKAMSNYPVQKEMYRIPNFIPTPINLWKFGCDTKGCPTMITDAIKDQYIYNLMIERSAKISRRGLEFMGLYYWNANDPDLGEQIYKLGTKTQKITIRFDPRCMGKIYYLRDNKLFCAELNSARRETEGFADMTYIEYVEYHNMRREMRRRGNDLNTEIDLYRFKNNELIVASAEKPNLSDTKRLREARAKEKQFINTQNTLEEHLTTNKALPNETLVSKKQEPLPQTTTRNQENNVSDDLMEAFMQFKNEQ